MNENTSFHGINNHKLKLSELQRTVASTRMLNGNNMEDDIEMSKTVLIVVKEKTEKVGIVSVSIDKE